MQSTIRLSAYAANMDPRRGETDDLATLSRLDETILLEELRCRYAKDIIYVSPVCFLCYVNKPTCRIILNYVPSTAFEALKQ